jgi:hypothetical protein
VADRVLGALQGLGGNGGSGGSGGESSGGTSEEPIEQKAESPGERMGEEAPLQRESSDFVVLSGEKLLERLKAHGHATITLTERATGKSLELVLVPTELGPYFSNLTYKAITFTHPQTQEVVHVLDPENVAAAYYPSGR